MEPAEYLPLALSDTDGMLTVTAAAWRPAVTSAAPLVLAHGGRSRPGRTPEEVIECQVGSMARALIACGHPVFSFNFPYGEAGRRRPGSLGAVKRAFYEALLAAKTLFGTDNVIIGGRSMGARVASHIAADGVPTAGLVCLGYPLHRRDAPNTRRASHWRHIRTDVLFAYGDQDHMCEEATFQLALARLPKDVHVECVVLSGANHRFRISGQEPAAVQEELARVITQWAATLGQPSLLRPARETVDLGPNTGEPANSGRLLDVRVQRY